MIPAMTNNNKTVIVILMRFLDCFAIFYIPSMKEKT